MIGTVRVLSLVALVVVAVAATHAPHPRIDAPPTAAEIEAMLGDLAAAFFACNFDCQMGYPECPTSADRRVDYQYAGGWLGEEHECLQLHTGCAYHNCIGEDEQTEVDRVVDLLPSMLGEQLWELGEQSELVLVNLGREAVQLLGCNGLVVAAVPFSDEQAEWFTSQDRLR